MTGAGGEEDTEKERERIRDRHINAMKGIETHTDEERQINSVTGIEILHTDAQRE